MKLNYCSNCFSSASLSSDNVDNSIKSAGVFKGSTKRKLIMPLEQYAMLLFGNKCEWNNKYCDNIKSHREYYSKFYTTAQLKFFSAGKEYAIERKHKVKKRDLLNDKFRNHVTSKNYQITESNKINKQGKLQHINSMYLNYWWYILLLNNLYHIYDATKIYPKNHIIWYKITKFIDETVNNYIYVYTVIIFNFHEITTTLQNQLDNTT